MGLAAAGTVAIAVLIAITLLPALLGFAGERVARFNRVLGYRPNRRARRRATTSVRWARFVTARPWSVLLVGLTLLGVVALPALHMKLGLPDAGPSPPRRARVFRVPVRGGAPMCCGRCCSKLGR